ncbi:MAG: ribbon-helix-helix domain-containing protein [Candidatus Saccharimonadales bacterium]
MKSSTNAKAINITLPAALIEKIDKAATAEYATRSDFIRDSIIRKLDAIERWEPLVDFTEIRAGGVPIEELLERLEKYDQQTR